MPALTLRAMAPHDAEAVAQLHAASWRTAYRGILSDAYLDGDVVTDRLATWRSRLELRDESQFGVVAEQDGALAGFVYVMPGAGVEYGALIDNLHVAPDIRSRGVGPRLLAAAAAALVTRDGDAPVHLWVWDANVRARAFYARMGGREVERTAHDGPDGTVAEAWRVVWESASVLQESSTENR